MNTEARLTLQEERERIVSLMLHRHVSLPAVTARQGAHLAHVTLAGPQVLLVRFYAMQDNSMTKTRLAELLDGRAPDDIVRQESRGHWFWVAANGEVLNPTHEDPSLLTVPRDAKEVMRLVSYPDSVTEEA